MSVRKAALAVVILTTVALSSSLSFAQTPTRIGDFKIGAIRRQLVVAPDYRADDVTLKYYVLIGKGRLVDQDSNPPSNMRWWEGAEPIKGYLLNPQQTPWSIMAFDRYEELKPSQ